jgi:hypothetical protein
MQQVTLSKVFREQKVSKTKKDKDGKDFIYTSLRILTTEYGNKWLSGFGNESNVKWKEGDIVNIEVTENGEYLNFSTPRVSKNEDVLEALRDIYILIEKSRDEILKTLGRPETSASIDVKLPF